MTDAALARAAYGPLGLKPWEFERLTMTQLADLLQGHRDRQQETHELVSWALHWIVNTAGGVKEPIPLEKISPVYHDREELHALMEQYALSRWGCRFDDLPESIQADVRRRAHAEQDERRMRRGES